MLSKQDLKYITNLILYQEILIKNDKETMKKVYFDGKEIKKEIVYLAELKERVKIAELNIS